MIDSIMKQSDGRRSGNIGRVCRGVHPCAGWGVHTRRVENGVLSVSHGRFIVRLLGCAGCAGSNLDYRGRARATRPHPPVEAYPGWTLHTLHTPTIQQKFWRLRRLGGRSTRRECAPPTLHTRKWGCTRQRSGIGGDAHE